MLLVLPVLMFAQNIPAKPVKFATGKSTAVIKGTIVGSNMIDYTVAGTAGKTLKVALKATSSSTYFNILAPGSQDEAIYNSSINGNVATQKIENTGEYKIRVYLFRNAARKGTKSVYTLTVTK